MSGPKDGVDSLYVQAREALRNALARAEKAETVLARVASWAGEYGPALIPKRADTYGEGVRDAKAQVKGILFALDPPAPAPSQAERERDAYRDGIHPSQCGISSRPLPLKQPAPAREREPTDQPILAACECPTCASVEPKESK